MIAAVRLAAPSHECCCTAALAGRPAGTLAAYGVLRALSTVLESIHALPHLYAQVGARGRRGQPDPGGRRAPGLRRELPRACLPSSLPRRQRCPTHPPSFGFAREQMEEVLFPILERYTSTEGQDIFEEVRRYRRRSPAPANSWGPGLVLAGSGMGAGAARVQREGGGRAGCLPASSAPHARSCAPGRPAHAACPQVMQLATYLTYFAPSISPRMWTLFPRMVQVRPAARTAVPVWGGVGRRVCGVACQGGGGWRHGAPPVACAPRAPARVSRIYVSFVPTPPCAPPPPPRRSASTSGPSTTLRRWVGRQGAPQPSRAAAAATGQLDKYKRCLQCAVPLAAASPLLLDPQVPLPPHNCIPLPAASAPLDCLHAPPLACARRWCRQRPDSCISKRGWLWCSAHPRLATAAHALQVLLPLDNYISKGADVFLGSQAPNYLQMTNQVGRVERTGGGRRAARAAGLARAAGVRRGLLGRGRGPAAPLSSIRLPALNPTPTPRLAASRCWSRC